MAPFIYAIPKVTSISDRLFEQIGLADVMNETDPAQRQFRHSSKGPGGQDCTLLMVSDNTKLLRFNPDEQTWTISRNEKFWVGFYNDDRPTEIILRRRMQLAGHEVELQDASKWLIPVARILTGASALPQSLFIDGQDEIIKMPLQKYAEFTHKVDKLWDDFRNETDPKSKEEPKLSTADRMHLAAEALAFNYHVGLDETNMLGLITTQNLIEIMEAIIDVPTLIRIAKNFAKQKKNGISGTAGDG